ncbi:B double prime 1, subunit of RNA polymerase III transcription initiation factor IIIB [Rhinolophus ferrumequinum]|uniref:B double prime 1, subunit of RNA polymerase III transcription initiation factor IIIB n=1 Tax=Rhinolophus ferrumequinum TaxID=59479 RepID=A0A7J7Y440_RHIFE|nr:B double prime 1, subunit of RNA polymerase III transcription initiation factor IIIB [Rhinolophus ferrumequinum]
MFRRARLSVKPNVRPGVGARGSTASNPQRGQEAPRPPEPAAASAPKPAEPTDEPPVDFGGAEPQEEAPRSREENGYQVLLPWLSLVSVFLQNLIPYLQLIKKLHSQTPFQLKRNSHAQTGTEYIKPRN